MLCVILLITYKNYAKYLLKSVHYIYVPKNYISVQIFIIFAHTVICLQVSLDYPFLVAPSVFTNIYLLCKCTTILCAIVTILILKCVQM